jgi:ATP-binding cassette subfamily B protein
MSTLPFISGVIVIILLIPSAIFPNAAGEIALSIGMFTALVNTVIRVNNELHWRVGDMIGDFKYKREYLKDLNNFAQFEEEQDSDCLPSANVPVLEKIEFKNVSFKYPGAEPYILKNFNLELNAGKHYAIVGINGAGKTTLTKILTKLYDNYEGEILINGRDLRDYSQAEIKAASAVVYQDFSRYPLDLYNNIAVGNILDRDNKERVENAVNIIGLTDVVDRLPRKYDTPLTKIKEDGVDLSGGEWQRIALARLIVSSAPLKILDEPTAALDPISESRVYEQFGEIIRHNQQSGAQGITIFISHRLGSTKLADEIIVISEGKTAEHGSFDELMQHGGLYAEMYESQAEWYRE